MKTIGQRFLYASALTFAMVAPGGCTTSSDANQAGDAAAGAPDGASDRGTDADTTRPPDGTTGCTGLDAPAGSFQWTVDSGGRTRTLRLHVPSGYDPAQPTPLVLNFHGYTSNAQQQEAYSGMIARANAQGFIAVHPEGVSSSWNAGTCCGTAAQSAVDDVGFVDDLLDAVSAEYCVDPARIYATGMSNGGFMSHRLACDLSHRIAAIASVAGYDVTTSCAPERPVPVIHFHGTADGTVDYNGVAGTIADWVARNGCSTDAETTYDNGNTTCETYAGCEAGAEVVSCTITNGGHTWPGAFGANDGVHATDAGWEFVSRFRL